MTGPGGVVYAGDPSGLTADHLRGGFFEGWPAPWSPERHLAHLRGAELVEVAVDPATREVVGFATAIGDGGNVAFVPFLEVLPAWNGGSEPSGCAGCLRGSATATPLTSRATRTSSRSTSAWAVPPATRCCGGTRANPANTM